MRPIGARRLPQLNLVTLDGDATFRDSARRDDIVHDNTRKAGFAATVLVNYAHLTGGRDEALVTLIGDLIGDLHHLADGLGIDLDLAYQAGRDAYLAEIRGQL